MASITLGVIVLATLIVLWTRQRQTNNPTRPTSHEPALGDPGTTLGKQMIEVKRLASGIADELDGRAARLERLIAQADDRIASLQRNAAPSQRSVTSTTQSTPTPAIDDTTREVYRLADSGVSPVTIAQTLGEHVGKVELILALRKV